MKNLKITNGQKRFALNKNFQKFTKIYKNEHKLIFNTEELAYINSLGINFFMRVLTRTRIKNKNIYIRLCSW